ncbi:lysoplasmalogenase [Pengzhenrongella frigida]|uniref:Lysoplasmalogenase n=2 Tax=Pengzhenrongella frigida TaxID=1259133 RepID=A0A4Q5MXJ1_9MICO|nr:lysoplasmalogenase [Cellulomonas sp. HLT2-17]
MRAAGPDDGRVARRPTALAAGVAVAGVTVAVVHLVALLADADGLAMVTKALLMPTLAAFLVASTAGPRPRIVRLTLVALGFSWLGDTAPFAVPDDLAFLVMVGFFLVAQLAYIAAFAPAARTGPLGRRPALAVPYVAALVLLLVACVPGAGTLVVPAVVYGVCLVTMAALAAGVHPLAAVGGVVFLSSDAMIALGEFTTWFTPPAAGFWVMLTYIAGQVLLVTGVLASVSRSRAPVPAA